LGTYASLKRLRATFFLSAYEAGASVAIDKFVTLSVITVFSSLLGIILRLVL